MRTVRIRDRTHCVFAALAALLVAACGGAPPDLALDAPVEIATPAGSPSGEPFLSPANDGVWLSWIERVDTVHEFRVARFSNGAWSEPNTVAASSNFFVNWADFPSIVELPDGRLLAHWLSRSGPGPYAYDVILAWSRDEGVTWSPPARPHHDGTETEHGFVTLFAMQGGVAGAVWLDGRATAGAAQDHDGAGHVGGMTLRFTTLGADGVIAPDVLVDDLVCDCCQTDVAIASDGPVLFYRDRSPEEVRDISARRFVGGRWSDAQSVHDDGWVIAGCPVNGPSAAASGPNVAVAWFTAAQDTPRVRLAFSDDAGATFRAPIRIDDGDPVGRADVLLLENGHALVSWLERADDSAEVRVRQVTPAGVVGPSTTVTASTAERASGFPRMTRSGEHVVFAWTEAEEPSVVRLAQIRLTSHQP